MAVHLSWLVLFTICLVRSTCRANNGPTDLKNRLQRLENLILDLKRDQDDVKKYIVERLEAMEEKAEIALTVGYQGFYPLHRLEVAMGRYFKDFRPTQLTAKTATEKFSVHKDCLDAYNKNWTTSGVYRISPDGSTLMDVYCDQELDGGGWTVFQRRQDGSVDFYRNWNDYKIGFGNLKGEFWLGNDNIHILTNNQDHKLKIQLGINKRGFVHADYSSFWIDSESQQYKLHVSGFSGARPPGDSLVYHNLQKFTTKDRDNDRDQRNCAQIYTGAWWYNSCHASNLNGLYGNVTYAKGVVWHSWTGHYISMTTTKMMVKRKASG